MSIESVTTRDAADLVCIQLEVHIWSGRRHLDKSDLIHANPEFDKLPEKDLANLGSVKICDPDEIKAFQKIKNKAEQVLARAGLPFLGAVGVPTDKYPEVFQELSKLQVQYQQLAQAFVDSYDRKVAEWKAKHLVEKPEWSQLFRDLPTADHVGGRLAFKFHPYRISAPADADQPALNQAFDDQGDGLTGELLREVADEAKQFVQSLSSRRDNGVVSRRDFVTPKTLGPLRRAAAKLEAFAFIDASIGPLAGLLKDLLDQLPDSRIEGQHLIVLSSVGRLLGSKSGMAELVELAMSGDSAYDAIACMSRDSSSEAAAVAVGTFGDAAEFSVPSSESDQPDDELMNVFPVESLAPQRGYEQDLSNLL